MLSASRIWRCRSRRKQRGIATTRLQEKSSRTSGNSESSGGGEGNGHTGSTGTLPKRRDPPPFPQIPHPPSGSAASWFRRTLRSRSARSCPSPGGSARSRLQPTSCGAKRGSAGPRPDSAGPDPRPPGAHQLPQRAEGAQVGGQLGQAVVAGVEDAQRQEAEAGGQRAQLVAAAGDTAGSRGAVRQPPSPNGSIGAGPYLRSRCARAWRLAMAGGTLRRQLWYRLSPSRETRRQAASGTSPKRFRDRSAGTRGTPRDMRDRDGGSRGGTCSGGD